ncbi:MAG: hypothetical protein RLN72_01965 [Henriciella sp.]
MKRLIATLAATTAFAAAPALADHHMGSDGAKDMDMSATDHTKMMMESEVTALKASQVFLAIDDENDGLISKEEWADWQNRSENNLKQFSEYDADADGDIEFSEYLLSTTDAY